MSRRSLPLAPFRVLNPKVTTASPQSSGVPSARTITAGTGLTGGGDLSADRTLNVAANADGSIVANANDIQVGVLATDAQHGARGGGTQHAAATTSVAGFMSAADKTKLDASGTLTSSAAADVGTTAAAGVATTAARADHVHDLTFTTLNTVLGQANASLGVNSQRISSVADPSSAQDAATKAYVDAAVGGGGDGPIDYNNPGILVDFFEDPDPDGPTGTAGVPPNHPGIRTNSTSSTIYSNVSDVRFASCTMRVTMRCTAESGANGGRSIYGFTRAASSVQRTFGVYDPGGAAALRFYTQSSSDGLGLVPFGANAAISTWYTFISRVSGGNWLVDVYDDAGTLLASNSRAESDTNIDWVIACDNSVGASSAHTTDTDLIRCTWPAQRGP